MKRLLGFSVVILAISFALTGCVLELGDTKNDLLNEKLIGHSEEVELKQSQSELNVDLKTDASKIILSSSSDKLVEANFRYNSQDLKPDFEVNDNSVKIKSRSPGLKLKKVICEWDVDLSNKVPVDINLKAEASSIDMDISDIKLQKLDMKLGASNLKLYSDKLNLMLLDEINIDADASTVSMFSVGNLNFKNLNVESDASRLSIDLTGEYITDAEVDMNVNASTLKLKLPENVGTKIIIEKSEISTLRIHNDNIGSDSENVYTSKGYDIQGVKLLIRLKLNVTTITLE